MKPEFITIAVPALNEEGHIERTLDSLALADGEYEILVMDGGSADRTCEIVQRMAEADARIRLFHNPGRIQAAALNLAARLADPRAAVLIRADAHCGYPEGFARTVAAALRENGAQSVVVPMRTVGDETCFQRAVAAAQNSKLGNGGSAHRNGEGKSGWIDHGHHAGFSRSFFLKLGGYDESFSANEDAEYDVRVHKAGGRVWMERSATVEYHPRKTPLSLWRQYFGYGKGRAKTVLKHGSRPKARQMVPVAIVLACATAFLASPFLVSSLLLPFAYTAACIAFGAMEGSRNGRGAVCDRLAGIPVVTMHVSWGLGFLVQAIGSSFKE